MMNMTIFYVFLFIVLLILSGLFVASEFSLTSVEPSDFIDDTKNHPRRQKKISYFKKAYENVTFTLSSIQLGITISTLLCGIIAPRILSDPLQKFLTLCGMSADSSHQTVIKILSGVLASGFCMIFGELLPKNYAIARPVKTAEQTVGFALIFAKIFRYFIMFYDSAARGLLRLCGIKSVTEIAEARSPQELSELVRNSAAHGNFDSKLSKLVDRSLQFGNRSAEELMTPRAKVETIDRTATIKDLIALASSSGFSRFPVIDKDFDETLGTIHIKQVLLMSEQERAQITVEQFIRPVIKIPASLTGDEVMSALRTSNSRIAIVVDEYDGNAGIVTYEDLIEEIVGEVHDEYDFGTRVLKLGKSYRVSGLLRLDEVAEETGLVAPEGDYETLAGLIMFLLGKIPSEGDTTSVINTAIDEHQYKDSDEIVPEIWQITVEKMDRFRVDEVLLTPILDSDAQESAPSFSPAESTRSLHRSFYLPRFGTSDSAHNPSHTPATNNQSNQSNPVTSSSSKASSLPGKAEKNAERKKSPHLSHSDVRDI